MKRSTKPQGDVVWGLEACTSPLDLSKPALSQHQTKSKHFFKSFKSFFLDRTGIRTRVRPEIITLFSAFLGGFLPAPGPVSITFQISCRSIFTDQSPHRALSTSFEKTCKHHCKHLFSKLGLTLAHQTVSVSGPGLLYSPAGRRRVRSHLVFSPFY